MITVRILARNDGTFLKNEEILNVKTKRVKGNKQKHGEVC